MKRIIAALTLCLATLVSASILDLLPAYIPGQYFVYPSPAAASNALQYINVDSGWLPFVNRRTRYRMDVWAKDIKVRNDGAGLIPRIPVTTMKYYGVTTNEMLYFMTNFPCSIESVQADWFPEEE